MSPTITVAVCTRDRAEVLAEARRRGEETALDEETAVRIASDRVVAAAKLSKSYDANVRTARSRADLAKPKPAPKRPKWVV